MTAIIVDKLSKSFAVAGNSGAGRRGLGRLWPARRAGELMVVRDLSFAIKAGERVAFIGPNGAGKSTTLKMLTGILHPTSGTAEVEGFVPWRQRRQLAYKIGIVFGQRSQLWYQLTVRQSLELLGKLYAVDALPFERRLARLAERFAIEGELDRRVAELSLGQRLRCEIAAALLHAPSLLLLDEPTIGLDVTAKAALRDHLNALSREDGTTILLTSHDTGDIERICERVIVIDHGAIILDLPLEQLRSRFLGPRAIVLVTNEASPVFSHPGVAVIAAESYRLTLSVDTSLARVDQVIAAALERLQVRDLVVEETPLEEVVKAIYRSEADRRQHASAS
jgi:ABC-2 type transport system ATP-binding protein